MSDHCEQCGGEMIHTHGPISDWECQDCGWPRSHIEDPGFDPDHIASAFGLPSKYDEAPDAE